MDSKKLDRILLLGLEDSDEHESQTPTMPLHSLMEQPGARIGRYKLLQVLVKEAWASSILPSSASRFGERSP